ncbi:uncharacterized protein il17rc [Hoplias malabaricus]|uniref:uncharacterized protein il17rc n=1 Tax=Hoplias malabaricus TaxID=27720 RepID=UPI0034624F43
MDLRNLVLLIWAGVLANSLALEKYRPEQDIICSQGLLKCKVEEVMFPPEPPVSGPVLVLGLSVKSALCCEHERMCKACLRITVQIGNLNRQNSGQASGQGEGDEEEEEDSGRNLAAAVTVQYHSAPNLPRYQKISFLVKSSAARNQSKEELVLLVYKDVFLGSHVNVTVGSFHFFVTFPTLKEVCPDIDVEECETPWVKIISERDALRVVDEKTNGMKPLQICVKRGTEGECRSSPTTIPLHTVTPCMCFQAWREGSSSRSEKCPFKERKDFMKNVLRNVSLFVGHWETRDGRVVLGWNLSAPCRLEAKVWPCREEAGLGGECKEIHGFRRIHNQNSLWKEDSAALWTTGSFEDLGSKRHFLYCVMAEVNGERFGPKCPHDSHRERWSVPVIVTLLMFSLAIVSVCLLRKQFKGWVSDWEKSRCSGGSGCGNVLLLQACGGDDVYDVGMVCMLEMELSKLGFTVCLDLCCGAELSSLGPGPWLHSKLDLIQKQGGKILLVLSDLALEKARFCWESWNNGNGGGEKGLHMSGVFDSVLTCILSAHLKGGATESFVLVQFDSKKLINRDRPLPTFLQDLELYSLPSESCRLLANLCPGAREGISMRLKRLLWLRRASRKLTKGLKNSRKLSLRPHAESVLTQVETLEEEKRPLHH